MDIISGFKYNPIAQYRALLETTMSNFIDYGIISLILIQLGAVIGSIAAYIRMRTQTDAIKTMRDSSNNKCTDIELRVEKIAAMFTEREAKTASLIANIETLKEEQNSLEKTARNLVDLTEANRQSLRSLKAAMSAFSRHSRKPATETEEEAEEELEAEQIDAFPPPIDKSGRRGDFGKAAL